MQAYDTAATYDHNVVISATKVIIVAIKVTNYSHTT